MRLLRALLWIYGIAAVLSLLVIPIGAKGWLGMQPDPLVAVFAIVLALPWSLLLQALPGDSPWLAGACLAGGMAFNVLLGHWVLRWWRRRRARTPGGEAKLH